MTVLVSDSFNRANSTTTLGTTDSYNGGTPTTWQYRSGSVFGISNNTAITESGTNPVIAYVDVGQSDVKVNVTAVLSNVNDYFMALFRYDPATNTGLLLGGNPIKIQSFSGSTYTNIATTAINNAANDVFQIVLSGSSITVYRNGTQVVSGTSTINQTKTCHGLIDWRSINNGWDNFSVEDLNTGGTGTTYTGAGTTQGISSLTTTEKQILNALGTAQGQTILTTQDILKFAENGTTQGISLVSGNAFLLLKENGSSLGQTSLFASEIFISGRGTIYSEGGISQGYSFLITNERMIHAPIPIPMIHLNGHIVSIIQLKGYIPSVIQLKGNASSMIQLKGGKP